jgi:hypothetical protein
MGTSLKTVCFPLPPLAAITDASVTNFTQISVQLPEGSKVFKAAWVEAMATDIITATGGTIGEWRLGLRLGAAGYTTVTQLNDIVHSGENLSPHISADFTAHFTANWAAQQSSEVCTCDIQIYLDQTTGTTFNFTNGWALLWVTYEYDDTSSTMVGNAWIPFDSPVSALATSKGSAVGTVPNLDTFLAYGSVSYKHCMVIVEGNEAVATTNTTDIALTAQIDTYTAQVTGNIERGLASDRYDRLNFDMMSGGSPLFTTNATHSLYVWTSTGSQNHFHHCCITMLVVFTYDATSANDGNISLMLPMDFESPMGGTTSSDYQQATRDLWIEEPTTITIQDSAYRWHWEQVGAIASLYFAVGSQAFVSYTDTAAAMCGGNSLQKTVNGDFTLARGKNSIKASVYRTDTTDKGWNISGFWIINYKCGKPSGGWGTANRSVVWPISYYGTGAAASEISVAATSVDIPDSYYFINALGLWVQAMVQNSVTMYSYSVSVERLSAEGGVQWERVYSNPTHDDPETGLRQFFAQMRTFFSRWPSDPDTTRMPLGTDRRWKLLSGQNIAAYFQMMVMLTYHTIHWDVTRAITGSSAGTVDVSIIRKEDCEKLATASRSGDGNYTVVLYDDTKTLFAEAREDSTHVGRSDDFTAS